MDFTFSDDQDALRDGVRSFLAAEAPGTYVRAMAEDPRGFTDEFWDQVTALGWPGLLVPEAHGGLGLGLVDMVVVMEEMGRLPLPGPYFSSSVMATLAARAVGADDLLAPLASGALRGTVALEESGHGSPVDRVRTRARRKGATWVLTGTKPLVLDGHTADWVLVAARTEEGLGTFLLQAPTCEFVPTLDPTRKAARLVLEETPVEPVGVAGDHTAAWRRVADDGATMLCAELVGVCDAALELAVEYAKVRVQFDRPIASFQAIRHKAVDMLHRVELARVGTHYAAWTADVDDAARESAVAMAKGYVGEAAVFVTGEDIQIHGGVGFTWDCDAHFYFKRAKQNDVMLGYQGWQRQRLADLVLAVSEASPASSPSPKVVPLRDAVAEHVRAGDALHLAVGHTRWTAAAREVVRQWWGRDPGFTLVMLSLSSLGALFFRGGLVRKVVTGYSGDTFPNFTPNPNFARAYQDGVVEVEHWSFLAFSQRLEAAARGLPAVTTRSIADSSMEDNDAYARVDTPFGEVGLLAPLVPDVALLHAPVADRFGNVAVHPPMLEGVWGALAARRGAIVTVEKVVDDLRPWGHLVRIPAHRVLAVCEAEMGAHPGGLYVGDLPVDGYGEDYEFWVSARAASRSDDYDEWIRHWVLEVDDQSEYLRRLGDEARAQLRAKAEPDSWQVDEVRYPPDLDSPPNRWEAAAAWGARHLADRVLALDAHAVLAGAGVANLAAWLAVAQARERGSDVQLTAEIGLWGYDPVMADPFVLNHRNFPRSTMLGDAAMVLGQLVGGPGTTTIACLGGAQVDRNGNINSTRIPDGPFLVGSGGGNDVASVAAECIVVALLSPQRTPERCGYITSPGRAVRALVTDLGTLEKFDGSDELVLTAVPAGDDPIEDRIAAARAACGWDLAVATAVRELAPPTTDEVAALRRWDPRGWFLRER